MLQKLRAAKSEKGQSLVEFAFSMVIVLVLLAGLVDFGRAVFMYLSLRDGAQEGAIFALYNPTRTADIRQRVLASSPVLQEEASNLQIQVTLLGAACTGSGVKVTVNYLNFPITMPFMGSILGRQSVDIGASVTDTILAPSCH